MRYRSRPVEIEAMQWWADGAPGELASYANEVVHWVNTNGGEARYATAQGGFHIERNPARIAVRTVNGWAYAVPGHYVVRGDVAFTVPAGTRTPPGLCFDFYPVDPETFEKRWEPVPADRPTLRPEATRERATVALDGSAGPADPPALETCEHGVTVPHRLSCDGLSCDSFWNGAAGASCFVSRCKCRCHRGGCPGPAAAHTVEASSECEVCNGTGIGYGRIPDGRFMETDCSECDDTGAAAAEPTKKQR